MNDKGAPFVTRKYTPPASSTDQTGAGKKSPRVPPPNSADDYGLAPPLPTEDYRPKPRFRTLRDFWAEYQPIAEVGSPACSSPVRSTR
jgi:hypothetical protein